MEISLIPDSAPFNVEQRAWLNGFLAGWLGLQGASTPAPPALPARAEPPAETPAPEPWHDPALALEDRLKLADGQPAAGRLMAAMAQLDCGACGYVCRTYAGAIARGEESRLNLCSPGGAETSKTLKKLVKETKLSGMNGNGHVAAKPKTSGWSRDQPYEARLLGTSRLNGPESEKSTHHIAIDLGADGPTYAVGDSLGVYPENCGALVAEVLTELRAGGAEPVVAPSGQPTRLGEALTRDCCLSEITENLLTNLAHRVADPAEADRLRAWVEDDGPIAGWDVLDLLRAVPSQRLTPAEFIGSLAPLRPRLYSISSSPHKHAGQVHLTVRRVSYSHNARERKGVASTMLADRVGPGAPVRVFVQKSHGFTLPVDPKTPIIMVGPGTGIAPFRAFLHERDALGATGTAWLFFGEQRAAHDFLYQDELNDFLQRGVLTRLDTAFSRDQEAKLYVQHRILEQGEELFRWLEAGAYLFVCGDAKRMANDVDHALMDVISQHGARDRDLARSYLVNLTNAGRYCKDVY